MLMLADRNFYGLKFRQIACASGAKLADGSYFSTVFDSTDGPRNAGASRARHRRHAGGLGHAATGQLPAGDQPPRPPAGAGASIRAASNARRPTSTSAIAVSRFTNDISQHRRQVSEPFRA
jgi:hypothetical protein